MFVQTEAEAPPAVCVPPRALLLTHIIAPPWPPSRPPPAPPFDALYPPAPPPAPAITKRELKTPIVVRISDAPPPVPGKQEAPAT